MNPKESNLQYHIVVRNLLALGYDVERNCPNKKRTEDTIFEDAYALREALWGCDQLNLRLSPAS